jgi:oligoribonuclease (3'-5' exoribonuclease)
VNTSDELATLEDQLAGLAERYRAASDAHQAACDQVRVMRETLEFAREREGVLNGNTLAPVRAWLRETLPGVEP